MAGDSKGAVVLVLAELDSRQLPTRDMIHNPLYKVMTGLGSCSGGSPLSQLCIHLIGGFLNPEAWESTPVKGPSRALQ